MSAASSLLPKAELDQDSAVIPALDLFEEIKYMTFVSRTEQTAADQLTDRAAQYAACISHSYGVFYHLLYVFMLLLLIALAITLSLGFSGSISNPSWALLCLPLWMFDFFLIIFAFLAFFVLLGTTWTLGTTITIGRPKFDGLARAFIPISGVLAVVFALAFATFTVLYEMQLTAAIDNRTPIGWDYVFIPLVVMWGCYVALACVSWIRVLPALFFAAELTLLYLRLDGQIDWDWFIVAIPMYVWAVYAMVAPLVFVVRRKRSFAVFSAVWTWALLLLFVCLWCAWGDDPTVYDFWAVLLPVDVFLALKLVEKCAFGFGSCLHCIGCGNQVTSLVEKL